MKKSTLLLSISFIALSAPLMAGKDEPQDSSKKSIPVSKQERTDNKGNRKSTMKGVKSFFTTTFHLGKPKQPEGAKSDPNNNNNITEDQTRDKRSSSSFLGRSMDQSKETINLSNNPQRQSLLKRTNSTSKVEEVLSRANSRKDLNVAPPLNPKDLQRSVTEILNDSDNIVKSDSQNSLSSSIVETGSRHSINRSEDKKTNLKTLSTIKKERLQEFENFKETIKTQYSGMYFTQDQLNDFAEKNGLNKGKVNTSFFAIKDDVKNLRDYLIAVEKAVSAHSDEKYSNPFDLTIRPYNIDLTELNKFAQGYGVKIESFGLDAQKLTNLMKTYAYYMSEGVYNKDMLRDANHPSGINMDMLDLVMMWKREFTQGMTEESSIKAYLASRVELETLKKRLGERALPVQEFLSKSPLSARTIVKNVEGVGEIKFEVKLDKDMMSRVAEAVLELDKENIRQGGTMLPMRQKAMEGAFQKITNFLPGTKPGLLDTPKDLVSGQNSAWDGLLENATEQMKILNAALTELEKM